MKKVHFKKGHIFYLPLLVFALSLLPVSSCKNEEKANFLMFCRQITKDEIQKNWVDKKWTQKGDPNFIFQLWFNVNKVDNNIYMDVNPMKSWDQFIFGGEIPLSQKSGCKKSLPDTARYVDNWINFDSLHLVADTVGNLIGFDYIKLTPVQDHPPYVNYKVEVMKNGDDVPLYMAKSWPCPPPEFCPKY